MVESDFKAWGRRASVAALAAAMTSAVLGAAVRSASAQGLPDLIVRDDVLEHEWVVREEYIFPGNCSAIEGEVEPGWRQLVRFTVSTANVGEADIEIGDPLEHYNAGDGLFELATCHNHFHFRNYALYELIDPATGHVWRAAKRGFCMLDTHPNPVWLGSEPAAQPTYQECGSPTESGNQGISHGWSDTYEFMLGGQYFVLDGGDGQPPVPPGTYVIRISANPPFRPRDDEPCRALNPATGLCHQFAESDYSNNVAEVRITIPDHPGRTGVGPLAGTEHPTSEPPEH